MRDTSTGQWPRKELTRNRQGFALRAGAELDQTRPKQGRKYSSMDLSPESKHAVNGSDVFKRALGLHDVSEGVSSNQTAHDEEWRCSWSLHSAVNFLKLDSISQLVFAYKQSQNFVRVPGGHYWHPIARKSKNNEEAAAAEKSFPVHFLLLSLRFYM